VIRRHTYSAQPILHTKIESCGAEQRLLQHDGHMPPTNHIRPPSISALAQCPRSPVSGFVCVHVAATSRWISGWRARRASRGVSGNSPSRQKNCTKTQSISFAPHCTTSAIFVALGTGLHGGEGRREKLRHFARITTIQADCHRTHLQNKHLPLLSDWEIEAARARPCDSYHAPYVSTWAY